MRAFQTLVHASPYLVFGQVACNSAILEAVADHSHIHIVDFGIAHGDQWPALIQALAARNGGPPHIHITGIDLPAPPGLRRANCCISAGIRLQLVAEQWGVPLRYDPLAIHLEDLRAEHIHLVEGEVLAVNCSLRLRQLLEDSVSQHDSDLEELSEELVRVIPGLRPEILTMVEQQADLSSPFFLSHFYEALHYYALLFEDIGEAVLGGSRAERHAHERHVLGKAILNVIASNGGERTEHHPEPLSRWQSRIRAEGFVPRPPGEGARPHRSGAAPVLRGGLQDEGPRQQQHSLGMEGPLPPLHVLLAD